MDIMNIEIKTMEFLEFYKELVSKTKIPKYNNLIVAIFKLYKIKK